MENSQTVKKCPYCGKENSIETQICSCGYYFDHELYEKKIIAEEKVIPSSGTRLTNYIIDSIAIYLIFTVVIFIIGNSLNPIILYGINFLLIFLYYYVFELISGRTLGKLITRTKVVSIDDQEPDDSSLAIRTICRFIPFEPFSCLNNNGWHDRFSKTKVVFV
ncbi:MAG TPA: RDD family protein [Bacteroidales bacterium]|nr:RDD family protein [Bacteroidales bacterium]HPS71906.1 RDD family protein [Bacteroidales bacterium]